MADESLMELMELVDLDWKDKIRVEIKQMRADMQALKKSVTKGDKTAKKLVQDQIEDLENKIASKQAIINSGINPDAPPASEETKVVTETAANVNTEPVPEVPQLYLDKGKGKKQEKKERKAATNAAKAKVLQDSKPKGPNYALIEQEKLGVILKKAGLQIFDIEPDGHCMFASVAHQMSFTTDSSYSYGDMRRIAADYILEHEEHYAGFIDDEEDKGAGGEQDGLDGYCQRIRSSTFWGGHLELDALAKALKKIIRVYQADSEEPLKFGEDEEAKEGEVLNLCFQRHAYSLGEHYDSLIPL